MAQAVFPLVIRAGGGSARDSLSVLDQLLAGAGPEGVTYERAVALLGVTDASLIDDMVDALAAGDRAAVFETVDRTVEAGHDPRRFAADLLQRLRDLTLLQAVPEAPARGLVDAADDEIVRMIEQADRLSAGTLARYGGDRAQRPDRDARDDRSAAAARAAVRAHAAARGDRGRAGTSAAARTAGAPQRDRGHAPAGRRDRRRTTCGAGVGRVATNFRASEQPPGRRCSGRRCSGRRRPAERFPNRNRRPGRCCRGTVRPRCTRCFSAPRRAM